MKALICTFAILASSLMIAPFAVAQQQGTPSDREAALLQQIERLEIVIQQLEVRIAELEESAQRGGRQESDEIRTVRRRLRVMRAAVEAYMEVGDHAAAEIVERAMHARELAIAGRRDEEAQRIREAAPNRAQLAEALMGAADLYKEWGKTEPAQALTELAEVYLKQWQQRQLRAEESEAAAANFESLATRLAIIRHARAAFAEKGDERNVKSLEHAIHFGELALSGASEDQLKEAAQKLPSMSRLIEQLHWASRQYREWGHGERAAACKSLADYYLQRGAHEKGGLEILERRMEILRYALAAFREIEKKEWADLMERTLHVAELQREGVEGEKLERAVQGLSMGMTIELLQKASACYAEWGVEKRAAACNELAEYYAKQVREHQQQEKEAAPKPLDLNELSGRMEVLRYARAAHAEVGHDDARDLLERAVLLGELQMANASPEKLAAASEGLSMELLIDLLHSAAELYKEWGHESRAKACAALAERYAG